MSGIATFGSGGAEPYARALLREEDILYLHSVDGTRARIDVTRWTEDADAVDGGLLRRARGPVLDVGCGPGRMVKAAVARGMKALGVDVSPVAVEIVRSAGLPVHHGSIFDPIPYEGSWSTALLLDGNIGIGGNPAALLARCRQVLRASGGVIVETHPDSFRDRAFECSVVGQDGNVSDPFAWAEVGRTALASHAADAGLRVVQSWGGDGRFFSRLLRAR
ncbi:MAG: class I SAM-dependent methyltransferase [Acidobacteria bacterium]|nr:class I SAM-dependent methyltransferase [Acidobacteriota bacterium]